MTINRLDGRRVLVVLGGDDMRDFALSEKAMSMSDAHSRRILLRLTRLACSRSGIDTRGKRLNVEALMLGEDCYLLVTVKAPESRFRLKRRGVFCYRFETAGDLLDAAAAAYRRGVRCAKNSVYEWDGAYYLIFDYPALPRALRGILAEFAEKCRGSLTAALIREHGRPVCTRSALTVIGEKVV